MQSEGCSKKDDGICVGKSILLSCEEERILTLIRELSDLDRKYLLRIAEVLLRADETFLCDGR